MIFGYKFWYKLERVTPEAADMYGGKAEMDRKEQEFVAHQAATKKNQNAGWFYRTFISWLS
ncbi:hypothetical protein K432DRAFT_380389 [Lepidopterella palustris CBS 459.81]|uniref:Uncharacterized protein n=1 Tax=Lepidopterella palustris CBS 459.81 TaxID=1314670 RepID=A0A8E2JHH2_9PEZI|nr:hypothetical protein K432DRAFT_380389 [Lepidopterella palustris CBS 459.81]